MPPAATIEKTEPIPVADWFVSEDQLPEFYGIPPAEFPGFRSRSRVPGILVDGVRRYLGSHLLEHQRQRFDYHGYSTAKNLPACWPSAAAGEEFKKIHAMADHYF